MSKHTPGPWRAQKVPRYYRLNDTIGTFEQIEGGGPLCWSIWRTFRDEQDRRGHRPISEVYVVGTDGEEQAEANARLIAAAPAMFDAAKAEDWDRLRAIIAKLEGEG